MLKSCRGNRRAPAGVGTSLFRSLVSAVWWNPAGRSARSALGLTRDSKAVSGKPAGTSPCGYVVKVKWKWSNFWVFDLYETFICYRGCLNLNCYIGKKVQKIFLMGLKIWWSWGSGKKISKTQQVGDFSKIDPQLDDYQWWFWVKFWGFDKKKSKSL